MKTGLTADHSFIFGYSDSEDSVTVSDAAFFFPYGNTGQLALNTSTPDSALHVVGGAHITGGFIVDDKVGIGTTPTWKFDVEDSQNGTQNFIAEIRNIKDNNSSRNNGLRITAGHSTFNSAESHLLQFKTPGGTTMGKIRQSGSNAVSYDTSSDRRLKTNIHETAYGLTDLLDIQVADYVFKSAPQHEQTGFIAQQLYEQYPHAVSKGGDDPNEDPWSVDYGKLTPLLVKAVQEQQAVIEELKIKNEELRIKIEELEPFKIQADQQTQIDELRTMIEALQNK